MAVRGYGMNVFSLGDPTFPQRFSEDSTEARAANAIVTQVIPNYGRFVYFADGRAGLQIYLVDNPRIPVRVGQFQTADLAKGICVYDRWAYLAISQAGLLMVNVHTRNQPFREGEIDNRGRCCFRRRRRSLRLCDTQNLYGTVVN